VEVYDRDRVWMASGGRRGHFPFPSTGSSSSSGNVFLQGRGSSANSTNSLPPRSWEKQPPQHVQQHLQQQHFSEHDISATVLQREAARLHKNYALADQLREQLRAVGVSSWALATFSFSFSVPSVYRGI